MFAIGIYTHLEDGGAVLEHIMGYSSLDEESAEKKVDFLNIRLGHKIGKKGGFTVDTGELYAMYDYAEDLTQELVGTRVF